MSQDRVVLPKNIVPSHYDLTLEPDLVACKFRGKVAVTVNAVEATARVVLHAIEVEIQAAKWVAEDGTSLETTTVEYEKESERASIVFEKDLPLGKASLHLDFTVPSLFHYPFKICFLAACFPMLHISRGK